MGFGEAIVRPMRIAALAKPAFAIVDLRGPRADGSWQPAEACAKAGITLLDFTTRSRSTSKEMYMTPAICFPPLRHQL